MKSGRFPRVPNIALIRTESFDMIKKFLLLLVTVGWLWAVQQRWGDLPLLSRFFTYATSPLQIDNRFENSLDLRQSPFGTVELGYDSLGVPHIFSEQQLAADYATGYVHARDRLFQMEMIVRVVTGRVSEVAGEAALNSDLFWRKFEFERLVPGWYAAMADSLPDLAKRLEAYAAGVNDYRRLMAYGSMPLEYHLLGIDPMEWKAENIFYLLKYMTHVLTYSEDDLKATEIRSQLGLPLYNFWYPHYSRAPHAIYPDFSMPDSLMQALLPDVEEVLVGGPGHNYPQAYIKNNDELSLGSNNWAVQGRKSATGNPFLCNDTHLQLAFPSTWYEVHKAVGGRITRGFSIAGSPFVITGFNDSIAWGMTNATWDLVDFYQLEVNKDATEYKLDGTWEQLEPFEVRIAVKGKADVVKTYYRSYFGPVDTAAGRYLAVNWIAMQPTNEALAFDGLERANHIDDAKAALQHFMQPPQNLILADHRGNIGLMTSGMACLHPSPEKGIRQGVKKEQRIGYTPMQHYLNHFNTPRAYVYSANQEHINHPLSAHISTRYEPAARGKRITELLEARDSLGVAELRALHMDVVDVEWRLLGKHLLAVAGADTSFFSGWEGQMDTALVAPTLFYNFKINLVQAMIRHLGGELRLPPSEQHIFNTMALDDSLPLKAGWLAAQTLAQEAWDSSLLQLNERFGANKQDWMYGKFHQTNIQHLLRLPQLAMPLFASNGNNRTVNVASKLPSTHAASMRTIIELTPQGPNALLMLTGGQSGRFNSPNYSDQVLHWLGGTYHAARLERTFRPDLYRTTVRFNR